MKTKYDFYQTHLEWESIDFPITITRIYFEKKLYDLPPDCVIEVWRGIDFKLKAIISGIASSPKALEIDVEKLEDNFIPKETIVGQSIDGLYTIELSGCIIAQTTSSQHSIDTLEVRFRSDLLIESITRKINFEYKPVILYEWYLSAKLSAWFPRNTKRSLNKNFRKTRDEIDPSEENNLIESSGSSRDFILINSHGIKCIVAIVPDQFGPEWAQKMCIEYRTEFGEIPSDNDRQAISELVSFVLGCQLLRIGSTSVSKNQGIVSQFAMNQWGDNVIAKCSKRASPPVDVNRYTNDWQRLEIVVNELLPKYLQLREKLQLKDSLWKYWIACDSSVGTNLPIFSSAVESLANLYLKEHTEIKLTYMDVEEYQKLIADELSSISIKLDRFNFRDILLNKIKNAPLRGGNEKINLFFESINLPIGAIEKNAIKARNKMAHSSIGKADLKKLNEYVQLTHAYQTLFHRIILRILNYEGSYIDYYSSNQIDRNIKDVISR